MTRHAHPKSSPLGRHFLRRGNVAWKCFCFDWSGNVFSPSCLASLPAPKITVIAASEAQKSTQRAFPVFPPLRACHQRAFARAAVKRTKAYLLRRPPEPLSFGVRARVVIVDAGAVRLYRVPCRASGSALGDLSHLWLPVVCNQVVPDPLNCHWQIRGGGTWGETRGCPNLKRGSWETALTPIQLGLQEL